MQDKQSIRWKRVVLINLAILGGCIVALFPVSPTTRLSVFGFSCLIAVIAFNFLFLSFYRGATRSSTDGSGKNPWGKVLFVLVWVYLIFEIFGHHIWK